MDLTITKCTSWITFLFCLASPLQVANASLAQPQVQDRIQQFVDSISSEKSHLQGGAIAILYKGKVVYKSTFGYQKGKSNAITPKTLFPLASVSKPVAATAIALLVDKGTLNLNQTYAMPYLSYPVTLKNILSHTTGYHFSGNQEIEHGMGREKMLAQLKRETPVCEPGKCYHYSNATYSLVEEILNTKQLNFATAIAGLRAALKTDGIQTVPLQTDLPVAYPHAQGKSKDVRRSMPFPPFYPKGAPAAAGVFASLDGMIELFKLQFGYRPDLISQKVLNEFQSPVIANSDLRKWSGILPRMKDITSYYGLGFRILKSKKHPESDLIYHSGYISGAVSFIGFVPNEEVGIIVLINQNSRFALQTGIGFWKKFLL